LNVLREQLEIECFSTFILPSFDELLTQQTLPSLFQDYYSIYSYTWLYTMSTEEQKESLKAIIWMDYFSFGNDYINKSLDNTSTTQFKSQFPYSSSTVSFLASHWHTHSSSTAKSYQSLYLLTCTWIEMIKLYPTEVIPVILDVLQAIIIDPIHTIQFHCPIRITCFFK